MRSSIDNFVDKVLLKSLQTAIKEQGLNDLVDQLKKIVPDVTHQYTTFDIDNAFWQVKVRSQHAFQISLVNKVIGEFAAPVIVDIGDSAGTHLQYLLGLHAPERKIRCLSVNLDAKAVEKIHAKGLEAVKTRAEDVQNYNIEVDIFMCFQTLEHLMNPSQFLYDLSTKTCAKHLIITVPYLRTSRVGLHHIRSGCEQEVQAEKTHIFELCPADWKLLLRHSGWDAVSEEIYLQYPRRGIWRMTQPFWRKFDFEGFYGMILKRDQSWSSKYLDW